MVTTPEIICNVFSFLDKDRIERIQVVNQFWNNVIIRHKNIWPLRQCQRLDFYQATRFIYIKFSATEEDLERNINIHVMEFDGTNLKIKKMKKTPFWYDQLTVDEILNSLNDVVFHTIQTGLCDYKDRQDNLLNLMKLVSTKTEGRFRGRFGSCDGISGSKLAEIFDNYIIVDELVLGSNSYIKVCANPKIIQLPSTPKEIRLERLHAYQEIRELLRFTCNGKLNGANRVTIFFETSISNYGNFIRQWFGLYRTHQSPISLVGKFELRTYEYLANRVLDVVKTFLNNTHLCVKYSFERKEFHIASYGVINQYVKRSCVLHETESYALVIEMAYGAVTDMSSINASDLDQPPCNQMKIISLCVKSL